MITINLLPDEYRRKAKTPVKVLGAIAVAVTANAALLAYWCYLTMGVTRSIETKRTVLQLDMDGLTPQVEYNAALDGEIQVRSAREKTLSDITKNRVLWTKVSDELLDVVHAGREGIEHYIWFDDITVKLEDGGAGRRSSTFGHLKASGHSGSVNYDQVANFLEDIEDPTLSSLSAIFDAPAAPEAKKNAAEPDLIPSINWSFPLELQLKSPEDRVKARTRTQEEGQ